MALEGAIEWVQHKINLRNLTKIAAADAPRVRAAIMANAVKEMRKGCVKFKKEGTELTVDNLLEEYRKDKKFKRMCDDIGLPESWFIEKAQIEIKRYS